MGKILDKVGSFFDKISGITLEGKKRAKIYNNLEEYYKFIVQYLKIYNNETNIKIISKDKKYLFKINKPRYGYLELDMFINQEYKEIGRDINLVLNFIRTPQDNTLSINPPFNDDLNSLNIINEAILLQIEETRADITALSEHKKNILAS